jgi:hypothetical protein
LIRYNLLCRNFNTLAITCSKIPRQRTEIKSGMKCCAHGLDGRSVEIRLPEGPRMFFISKALRYIWGPPSLLYNGYQVSFPVVKRPTCAVDCPRPFGCEVKERVEVYLCSPSALRGLLYGELYLILFARNFVSVLTAMIGLFVHIHDL